MGKFYEDSKITGGMTKISDFSTPEECKNLNDYFDIDCFDDEKRFIKLFYDCRTIYMTKLELEEFFLKNGWNVYIIEKNFEDGLSIRIYDLTDKPQQPDYGSYDFIQTWDNNYIFSQSITSTLRHKVEDAIVINKKGIENNKLILFAYNTGISDDIRSEIHFWEFKDNRWQTSKISLKEEINYGYGDFYLGDNANGVPIKNIEPNIIYYDDGISFGYVNYNIHNIKVLYNTIIVIQKN